MIRKQANQVVAKSASEAKHQRLSQERDFQTESKRVQEVDQYQTETKAKQRATNRRRKREVCRGRNCN